MSSDSEFAFILEETLSLSNNFGANTGEVLRAASQIVPGDYESWYKEFKFLADALHSKATAINATRFPVSARETYFRSSSYYRAADFFLHGNLSDPRIYSLWDSALHDFDRAIELLPIPAERTNVSTGGFSVPVIFYPAQALNSSRHLEHKTKKLPTVLVGSGYDGSQEESYHQLGRSVADRGWNFVTYEGPGQPTVRRQQKLGFIQNWWDVVTPVMDYLASRPDVDMERVALVGLSFGGTLAPRAASREHRLSAVLAIDGLIDMYGAIREQIKAVPILGKLFDSGNATAFDDVMLGIMGNHSYPTQLRWLIAQSLFSFNTTSPFDWFTRLREFTADATVLNNITCPVFVASGEDDTGAPGQPERMADILGKKATYSLFKTDLGAGGHCQIGAESQLSQEALDWLDGVWEGITMGGSFTSEQH